MSDTYQNFPSTIDKLSAGLSLTNATYTIGASTIAQISSNQLLVRNYGASHTIVVFPEEYDYVKTGQKFRLAMIMGADRNSGHNFTMSGHYSHPADWGGDYICNVSSNVAGEISVDLSLKKVYSVNNTNWTICAVFNYSGDGSANGANSEAWYKIKEDNSISSPAGTYQGIGNWAHGVYRYQATLGLTQPIFQTTAGDTGVVDTEKPVITLTGDATISVIQGDTYTELGATWADNLDGSGDATVTGTVDTSTIGSYTISYNYTDDAGNVATEVTRTVNVEVVGSPPAAFSVPDLIVNENTVVNHEVSPSGGDWTTTVTNLMSPLTLSGNYIVGTTQEVPGYKNVTVSVAQTATVTRTNSYGSTSAQLDILVLNTTEEPTDTGGDTGGDTGDDTGGDTGGGGGDTPSGVNINSILYKIGLAIKSSNATSSGAVSALDTRVTALETEIDGGTYS